MLMGVHGGGGDGEAAQRRCRRLSQQRQQPRAAAAAPEHGRQELRRPVRHATISSVMRRLQLPTAPHCNHGAKQPLVYSRSIAQPRSAHSDCLLPAPLILLASGCSLPA